MFVTESGTVNDSSLAGGGGAADASETAPQANVRRRMDLARRVAGGTADGGCRLADGVVDVPVLLAMVVQGMRMDDEMVEKSSEGNGDGAAGRL